MVSGMVERNGTLEKRGSLDQHNLPWGNVGVVSVPLKATSSDLNRVSKKEHHQEEGGLAQDVNAQAQVSIKVEGLTVKQRVGSDEKKTGRWIDREEG